MIEKSPIGAFIAAAEAQGQRFNPDYNGRAQEGVGWYQVTGRGASASRPTARLKPARGRANLTVLTDARVTRILLDGAQATGVALTHRGQSFNVAATEVIMAAGAVQTPQLLELSGIGDAARLKAMGIAPFHDLPGVGENYLDHFCTRMNWRVSKPITLNELTRWPRLGIQRC